MPKLKFISDKDLYIAVDSVLKIAEKALKNKDIYKNAVDPCAMLFERAGFNFNERQWVKTEKARQAQKTLQNSVGAFHQTIIGSVKGFKNLPKGGIVDIVNKKKKIVAEIKNKHNTAKGDNKKTIYETLDDAVLSKTSIYHGYTSYYVEIVPKGANRYNEPFVPSDNKKGKKKPSSDKIRRIDGYSFYALVTGIPDALEQLIGALPDAINKCAQAKKFSKEDKKFITEVFDRTYKKPAAKKKKK